MADELSHKALLTSLSRTFVSGRYYDLIIKCKTREWKVHRAIICGRSKFFEKACDGNWKEAQTRTINLPDDDPENVERMLVYLYTLEYDLSTGPTLVGLLQALIIHAQIYSMADKYDIPSLKVNSSEEFKAQLARSPVLWVSPFFVKVLQAVYEGTPGHDRGLRGILEAGMRSHASALAKRKDIQELVKANGDFAVDMVKMLSLALDVLAVVNTPKRS